MPPVAACIVPPTRPDPLISGAPVAGVFTIGSAALVASSAKLRSSVKRTRTRTALPRSSAVTV